MVIKDKKIGRPPKKVLKNKYNLNQLYSFFKNMT